ncbi:EVE domain-containing protein [Arenibacter sp. TNZ]|uniref:McrB family protein n=1 Tax=Arenibacter TaxID=178469 RepID=UPI000CD41CA3|nr:MULTISPECIES: AAA family ATPase [Arenibacter]MCM4171861.1 EVE domain-containing protein [Arenibacter sp. TNZ]
MIPNNITKEHLVRAIEEIDKDGIRKGRHSSTYDIAYNGKNYPPKLVISIANRHANGKELEAKDFVGGKGTDAFDLLEKEGFEIIQKKDPIQSIIEKYKKHIALTQLKNEVYKWEAIKEFQGRPFTNAVDFGEEIKAVDHKNLVYAMSKAVLKQLAKEKPEELRNIFKFLFNDNLELRERVIYFNKETLKLYRGLGETLSHHQDERSIAAYLTYYNPIKYTFYKSSFYKKYCKLIGVKEAKKNEKYVHYLSLVDDFIKEYIESDSSLIEQVKALIPEYYNGTNHKLLAQDILYQILDKEPDLNYWIFQGNPKMFDFETALRGGILTDWTVSAHKNKIKIGDKVILWITGNKAGCYALAEVTSEPYKKTNSPDNHLWKEEDKSELKADIKITHNLAQTPILFEKISDVEELKEFNVGNQGTNFSATQEEYEKFIEMTNNIGKNESKKIEDMNLPLNTILYGPPGTGKTYNTINKALELCGEDLTELSRTAIKERFEQKVDKGRIVFTTFHQSMSYEDFVEGIKPIEPEKEGDPVVYRVEEGIFRKLCNVASFSIAKEGESVTTGKVLNFSLAFDNFVEQIEEKLTLEEPIELPTKNGGKVLVDGISQQGNIIIKHPGKDNTYPASKQRLSQLHTAFPDLSELNNIDQQFRSIIGGSNSTVNWAVLNAIRNYNTIPVNINQADRKYSPENIKGVVEALKKDDYKDKKGEPFVLIIDEINRGNVSQIFGELITLIEEDKRLGRAEAIQVQLPYSKKWFGVPPNVHIIGTMNTADRSVEALDTALRRRFSFIEMPPLPELIKTHGKAQNGLITGIDISQLLKTINNRIEKLLDKDHMIGHSYFLSIEDLNELKAVFQNKIIPLLQEYFFGDYGKIGLILGAGFFDIEDNQVEEDFFAPFEDYDSSPLLERKVYHLKNTLTMNDKDFLAAIQSLSRKNK